MLRKSMVVGTIQRILQIRCEPINEEIREALLSIGK